jgi:hypothetical protein
MSSVRVCNIGKQQHHKHHHIRTGHGLFYLSSHSLSLSLGIRDIKNNNKINKKKKKKQAK